MSISKENYSVIIRHSLRRCRGMEILSDAIIIPSCYKAQSRDERLTIFKIILLKDNKNQVKEFRMLDST